MYFNVLTEIKLAVFLGVHPHTCDDFMRGMDCQNPSLPRGNSISPKNHEVHKLNDNPAGTLIEWKSCDGAFTSLFGDGKLTFNLPYMFFCCCEIKCDGLGHYGFYRFKLHVKQKTFTL